MKTFSVLLLAVLPLTLIAQQQATPASPEIARLWKAFGGDWNNTEIMEPSDVFPKGGSRTGTSRWRLGIGGSTIIDEGHSDGSAGPLDHMLLFWWDDQAKIYHLFVCFKDQDSGCKVRGTAHWEGNTFVNDYEEPVHGKPTKMRDSFIDITPNAHTLVFAADAGNGTMKTLITTKSVRRKNARRKNDRPCFSSRPVRRHPERSRSSGVMKDLQSNWTQRVSQTAPMPKISLTSIQRNVMLCASKIVGQQIQRLTVRPLFERFCPQLIAAQGSNCIFPLTP